MIPHKLQLKNFLSYGSQLQTIDFTGYNLICLAGKNGHGKSAILDAMTWALWGQARKVMGPIKADEGLMRLGQTHMMVIFDFEFNNTLYRIRREFGIAQNKAIAILEFGMIDHHTKSLIPLTDKTIRTTQKKIDQTIRLDFESFVNSAFLRQGGSNEFSKKTAKERKNLLANILGLDQYEIIRVLAIEKIKQIQLQKDIITSLQEKRKHDLIAEQELIEKNQNITTSLEILTIQEQEWHAQQHIIEQEQSLYNTKEKEYEQLLFQKTHIEEQESEHQRNLRSIVRQWRTVNKQKHSLQNIKQLEKIKTDLFSQLAKHQELLQTSLEYKEKILHITHEMHGIEQQHKESLTSQNNILFFERERLETNKRMYEQSVTEYTQQIAQLNKEQNENTQKRELLEKINAECIVSSQTIETAEQRLEKRKSYYHQFVASGNIISGELTALIQKNHLINDDNPSCPLCEQNLSAARRRLLKTNFECQEKLLRHQLTRLKRIIPALKEILITEYEQLKQNKLLIQTYETNKNTLEGLLISEEKIKQQIEHKQQQLDALTKELVTIAEKETTITEQISKHNTTSTLETDRSYQSLTKQKQELEKKIFQKPYNDTTHKSVQNQIKEIDQQLYEHENNTKIVAQQEQRKSEINTLCIALKSLKQKKNDISKILAPYRELTQEKQELIYKTVKHKQILVELRKEKEIVLQLQGSLASQLKQIEKIKIDYQKDEAHSKIFDITIEDYSTIATATGKDGIQALLIEDAIPEIEQEANNILSRLTNNQAHIFIESLRDLKRGGTKETLDIKISDSSGIRPYEMFSGGEAFRIDFALRIAISKLLARRAGTALQTLIIDEGFGSQDEEGLNHIMDAIHIIQNDFSKIIIVSHLSSMKDQFPVQFFVEKRTQGSTIRVVEQG